MTTFYDNYYIAGSPVLRLVRQATSRAARTTSGTSTQPDYVDHYAYQQGLLISYWDTSQANNNVSEHPGQG